MRPHVRHVVSSPLPKKGQRGFTLIELMVAIAVMAMLALMSWRGIDGMARAQEHNRARGDAVLTLQTTLSQWTADLDAMTQLAGTSTIDWDGRLLRVTRRGTDDLRPVVYVVAWTLRTQAEGSYWSRWQSAPLTRRDEWQAAWRGAASWAQGDASGSSAGGVDVRLMPVDSWQLYYFRNDTWSPAVGTDALSGANPNAGALPDGVRLVLNLPPGPALTGLLSRDWVRPSSSIPKT
ncbi:prepilin-type N-terminal cleavage/methylation domain-containing protein [Variovorax robiniae]|uniref:Prepilin-type N-terminal cleavage/methylation domain-containing protein n=1 Tax=Variovorax robiniae TaxID=1836199 RepID=A0ABU8X420_9BURK